MKKTLMLIFTALIISGLMSTYKVSASTYEVIPKAPNISASLKPCIAMYKQGNYIGAMQDLKEIVEKEPKNTYAKYYLALCYTQLGYSDEARGMYQKIVEAQDNAALTYYSQRALDCIGNPENEQCKAPAKKTSASPEETDEITKFIQSGKQFHPSVTDRITKERMERQIQKEEYEKKLQNERSSDASMPTNEEIAAALNTLSKLGMNPYTQMPAMNNIYSGTMFSNNAMNPDYTKMILYSQLMSGQNNWANFGI